MAETDRFDPDRAAGRVGWVPGLDLARGYRRGWLRHDLLAALALTALLVPQGMAYAQLAGLPAVTGLYTSVVALLAYAVFGPSRIMVVGPDSALGPMIAAAILPLVAANRDPATGGRLGEHPGSDHGGCLRGGGSSPGWNGDRASVPAGPGRLPQRPGHRRAGGPASEAVRLQHRRPRTRRRDPQLRGRAVRRQDRTGVSVDRAGLPGDDPGPSVLAAQGPRRLSGRGGRHRDW